MSSHEAVGIAVAQFVPGEDLDANLLAIRVLAERAARRGAEIVIFPEYSSYFQASMGPGFVSNAQPLGGLFVHALGAMAGELGVHLVAGLVETAEAERFSNTVIAVAPTGELEAVYRKQHLYDAFGQRESDWVVPGDLVEPETFVVSGLRFGLQTCYDIRFPEVTRRLADAGADVVLVPAEWVSGPLKEFHWRTLMTARAIENTVYVAAADHTPPVGAGNSMIVDPMGAQLAGLGEEEGVVVAYATAARIASVRGINPSLALRRFGVVPRG